MYQSLRDAVLWMSQLTWNSTLAPAAVHGGLQSSVSLSASSLDSFISNCSQLQLTARFDALPGARIHFTQFLPTGTNLSLPVNGCNAFQIVSSDICRVAMSVQTSIESGSEISLEAWFPIEYSGRFLSTGNRGFSGCIPYDELDYAASLGFASIGANGGHNGTSGKDFLNNPDVLEDFTHRSVHTGVVVGKALVNQFYGFSLAKSYYLGCSTGGRQGFKEAQDYPADFDGILAGAPAIAFTRLVSWGATFYKMTGNPGSDTFLTPELWALVHDEVLRQCDSLDGAKDGLLSDPSQCQFIPETLLCRTEQTSSCLTGKQAKAVRSVFSPFYGDDGTLLYPRMPPGINTKERVPFYLMGAPFLLSEEWFKYVIYNDTNWDPASFSIADAMASLSQNPFNIDTWNGNLSAFAEHGGKLLTYHGTQDIVISSEISGLYYSHVARAMNKHPSELDDFYRLFYIAGMDHCGGGDGASAIGNRADNSAGKTPNENALMALVRWVEEGIPPDVLGGAKLSDGRVEYRRNHCRWPKRSRYGRAWECV